MLAAWTVGLLLAAQAAPEADIAALRVAVQREPSNGTAWKQLGMALAAGRESEQALAALGKACELDPKDEDACYFLGRQLFSLGRYREAVAPLEKAVRASSSGNLARSHRAAALNRVGNGDDKEAERHFREAVRAGHGPEQTRVEAAVDYGAFLYRQGRTEESRQTLAQAVRDAPDSARAHRELGRVLLHENQAAEAVKRLERAVELDLRSAESRMLLGRAYLALGRTEEGERQLRLGREGWQKAQPRVQ